MAYTKYSLPPANNNSAPPDGAPEGMLPSAVNDTMRDMMAQIRDCGDGIRDGTYTMTAAKITGGSITGITFSSIVVTGGTITGITDLAVADGGTGASTAANARTNLSAAGSGANSDITSITGLTTPLTVAQGGTGAATLTANNVILGNGTSAPSFVAPSTNGNVLTSNGTTWTSAAAASGSPIVFLATTTTSTSVSSVDFSGFDGSTYIAYMIQIQGVRPASDNGQLRMQLRNSSGTITATDYHNGLNTTRSDSGFVFAASSGVNYFNITSANVRSSTAGGCQGIIFISQSANATPSFNSMISWFAPPDNVSFQSIAGGAMNATQTGVVITGFNFLYASGNITSSSKFTVYGLKAS